MAKKNLLFLLFCALTIVACRNSAEQPLVKTVKVVKPECLGMEADKQFSGIVKEARDVNVGFKTGGQIERIYVKEGDYVRKGQLIAMLDTKDYRLGVEASQIQYDQLKAEVGRLKVLADARNVSGNDYEKALAGLRQVGVKLQSDKNQLSYCVLRSPSDGYVQQRNYEVGEMVQAGSPIVNILDVNGMEVEVDIPAVLYANKEKLRDFSCTSSIDESMVYSLHLVSITPKANNSQLYTMKLAFVGSKGKLTSGMNVNVRMKMSEKTAADNIVALPVNALFRMDGKNYVWLVEKDNTVLRKQVSVGSFNQDGKVVIKDGLYGNETVVCAGVHHLTERQKVRILNAASKTNVGDIL